MDGCGIANSHLLQFCEHAQKFIVYLTKHAVSITDASQPYLQTLLFVI